MPHYYDREQNTPLQPEKIFVEARDRRLELWTGSGVFSRKRLDAGTRLLLAKYRVEPGWHVHDLGCGIGVVGVFVKLECPSCKVFCSDVSARAIKLTRMNAKALDLDIETVQSDGYEKIEEEFDTVLLNPPYVAGRKVVFRLVEEAARHLKPGGLLQVVARHQKGGKMIAQHMESLLGNLDDSAKGAGYRVYVSRKEPSNEDPPLQNK